MEFSLSWIERVPLLLFAWTWLIILTNSQCKDKTFRITNEFRAPTDRTDTHSIPDRQKSNTYAELTYHNERDLHECTYVARYIDQLQPSRGFTHAWTLPVYGVRSRSVVCNGWEDFTKTMSFVHQRFIHLAKWMKSPDTAIVSAQWMCWYDPSSISFADDPLLSSSFLLYLSARRSTGFEVRPRRSVGVASFTFEGRRIPFVKSVSRGSCFGNLPHLRTISPSSSSMIAYPCFFDTRTLITRISASFAPHDSRVTLWSECLSWNNSVTASPMAQDYFKHNLRCCCGLVLFFFKCNFLRNSF